MTNGIVDRFRSMPVSGASILVGHVVASVVRNLIATMTFILMFIPYVSTAFVPASTMPAVLARFRRAPAVYAGHRNHAGAMDGRHLNRRRSRSRVSSGRGVLRSCPGVFSAGRLAAVRPPHGGLSGSRFEQDANRQLSSGPSNNSSLSLILPSPAPPQAVGTVVF